MLVDVLREQLKQAHEEKARLLTLLEAEQQTRRDLEQKLLASAATTGTTTPPAVVAVAGDPGPGHRRPGLDPHQRLLAAGRVTPIRLERRKPARNWHLANENHGIGKQRLLGRVAGDVTTTPLTRPLTELWLDPVKEIEKYTKCIRSYWKYLLFFLQYTIINRSCEFH